MFSTAATSSSPRPLTNSALHITAPELSHGGQIWQIAKDSGELDLNSSYMYLLFARDFSASSRVVLDGTSVVAFVLAYRRAEDPGCLFVWQVAVSPQHQGAGLARGMLDDLIVSSGESEQPILSVETTVTEGNIPSRRLFQRLAERWGATLHTCTLFDESHFPDQHEAELLHVIGPIDPRRGSS